MKNNRIYLSPPHTSTGSVQAWEKKKGGTLQIPALSLMAKRMAFDSNGIHHG